MSVKLDTPDVCLSLEEELHSNKGNEPSHSFRRGNCASFRILIRRQLWSGSTRVASSLRKLFRSRKSSQSKTRRRNEDSDDLPEDSDDLPEDSSDQLQSGSIRQEPVISGGSASKPVLIPRSPLSIQKTIPASPSIERASKSDDSSISFSSLLRKSSPNIPLEDPNAKNLLVRSKRLMKEFRELKKLQNASKHPMFTVELVNDCLYEWKVKLHTIDPDSELARDMVEFNIPYILLNITFPEGFPFQPPFLRVLAPRLHRGFVMEGGAICMELLTPRGWASAYTIEAILMQFAASLVKGEGRVARKYKPSKEFNKRSAEISFKFLVKTHDKYGWVTPSLGDG